MKLLLSGGSGFIGKNLINYLTKNNNYNDNILVIGRNLDEIKIPKVKKIIFDLNKIDDNFEELKKFNPDIFLHLAWEGIPDYSDKVTKKNYLNSMKIIKKIINETSCNKIISTGSCWEYDDGYYIGECKEDQLVNPTKPFAINKNKIFNEVYKISKDKKILFNWLRLFYVYGKGQRKDSIIPYLIDRFKNNKKININFPSNRNDFILVDDVVKIIFNFITKEYPSGIYNIGTGKSTAIYELMKIIDKSINGNDMISTKYLNGVDLNKSNQNFYASTKKLKKNINDIKLTDINIGIRKMVKNN